VRSENPTLSRQIADGGEREHSVPRTIFIMSYVLNAVRRLSTAQDPLRLKGLCKLKKCNNLIGSRICNLPACSIVAEPTALPVAPEMRRAKRSAHREIRGYHLKLSGAIRKTKGPWGSEGHTWRLPEWRHLLAPPPVHCTNVANSWHEFGWEWPIRHHQHSLGREVYSPKTSHTLLVSQSRFKPGASRS
jgi:hypothetical protein